MTEPTPAGYLHAVRMLLRSEAVRASGGARTPIAAAADAFGQRARTMAAEALRNGLLSGDTPETVSAAFVANFGRVGRRLAIATDRAAQRGLLTRSVLLISTEDAHAVLRVLLSEYLALHREIGMTASRLGTSPVLSLTASDLQRLRAENPEFTKATIHSVAIGHPIAPQRVLNEMRDLGRMLRAKFPHADDRYISYVVTRHRKDPERVLSDVLLVHDAVRRAFPRLEPGLVIRTAITRPADPYAFVMRVLQRRGITRDEFLDLPRDIYERVRKDSPTRGAAELARVRRIRDELARDNPEVDPTLLVRIAADHPQGAQRALDNALAARVARTRTLER